MNNQARTSRAAILRRLLPTHWAGYVLIIGILLFQIGQYLWRVQGDEFIMEAGLGLFFIAAPMLLIILPIFAALVLGVAWYTLRTRGNLVPLLVFCIGYFTIQYLPLPPSPAETAFYAHQAAYEAVVQLARKEGLGHSEDCGYAFALPKRYEDLTRDCVFLVDKPALAIAFSPTTSHRVIAYAEQPEALNTLVFCGIDGNVFKQLESTWYICTPAQD
jgi:hypothetical protein